MQELFQYFLHSEFSLFTILQHDSITAHYPLIHAQWSVICGITVTSLFFCQLWLEICLFYGLHPVSEVDKSHKCSNGYVTNN